MKEHININKRNLYHLVKHYFEGDISKMSETEYRRANNRSGWLYFHSMDNNYYQAFF